MNSINIDERIFKNLEFLQLPVGAEFYTRRPRLTMSGQSDTLPLKKTQTIKNLRGAWINTISKAGQASFTPYDKKVLIEETQ